MLSRRDTAVTDHGTNVLQKSDVARGIVCHADTTTTTSTATTTATTKYPYYRYFRFSPRDARTKRGIAIVSCPSVRLSVRLSVCNFEVPWAYTVCAKKVTPFWYLSFLPLLDALYLQFLITYISFSLNA